MTPTQRARGEAHQPARVAVTHFAIRSVGVPLSVALTLIIAQAPSLSASADEVPTDRTLQAAIALANRDDAHSPQALSARLDYARFLVDGPGTPCGKRLDDARAQLDTVNDGPALKVVLPIGMARATDLDYRIHLGHADCSENAALRERELRAALEAAQRAVDLYRDAFDYLSMATMQFNVGLVHRRMQEGAEATTALDAAIAMDWEWGFAADAEENTRTLLRWKNESASDADVTAQLNGFPHRSCTLKLGWAAGDARVSIRADYRSVVDNVLTQRSGSRTLERQIRPVAAGGWAVSYAGTPPEFDAAGAPIADAGTFETLILYFARSLLAHAGYKIGQDGNFKAAADPRKVADQLLSEASGFNVLNTASGGEAAGLQRAGGQALQRALDPTAIQTSVSEDYNLETGMWVGATLEQGVWYDLSANLSLTAAPAQLIKHRMEFAYTRSLPCTPNGSDAHCVELVIHATPDAAALSDALDRAGRQLASRGKINARYWSALYVRLVVDPDTLRLWARDTRRYVYIATRRSGSASSLSELERTSATYSPSGN